MFCNQSVGLSNVWSSHDSINILFNSSFNIPQEQCSSTYASSPASPTPTDPHPPDHSDPTSKTETSQDRNPNKPHHSNANVSNHVASNPPQHSFVPVTPAVKSSPRADNEVIIHPVPAEDLATAYNTSRTDTVVIAEVHASLEIPVSGELEQPTSAVVEWPRQHNSHHTHSLSSSERGSNRLAYTENFPRNCWHSYINCVYADEIELSFMGLYFSSVAACRLDDG